MAMGKKIIILMCIIFGLLLTMQSVSAIWRNSTRINANTTDLTVGLVGIWDFNESANDIYNNLPCSTTATHISSGGWANRGYYNFNSTDKMNCSSNSFLSQFSNVTMIVVSNGSMDFFMSYLGVAGSFIFGWNEYGTTDYRNDFKILWDSRPANQWTPQLEGERANMNYAKDGSTYMTTGIFNGTTASFFINGTTGYSHYGGYSSGTGWDWLTGNFTVLSDENGSALQYIVIYNRSLTESELNDFYFNQLYYEEEFPYGWINQSLGTGLIGYWDMNEGTGTNIKERVSGNDATLRYGNWTTSGKNANATYYSVNNMGANLSSPTAYNLQPTDNRTWNFWLNLSALTNPTTIWAKSSGVDKGWMITQENPDYLVVYFTDVWGGTGTYQVKFGGALSTNQFKMYTVTYDGRATADGINLYVDGVLWASKTVEWNGTISNMSGTEPMSFGWKVGVSNMNGTLDEPAIWDRTLSPEEIFSLYNYGKGLFYEPPPINVTIYYPTNTTYLVNVSNLNYSTLGDTESCWYSNGVITSPPQTCGTNWTDVPSSDGSNTWTVYANDSYGNINSESVTFYRDIEAPTITLTNPSNNSYANTTANFTAQISDATGIDNATLYIYNETGIVYSQFADLSNPTYAELGIEYDIYNNGNYNWYYNATDIYGRTSQAPIFVVTYDMIPPVLNWYTPTTSITVGSSPYTINVSAYDTHLTATNVTVFNVSNSIIFSNYSGNVSQPTWWMIDAITLNEGTNTLQICAVNVLNQVCESKTITLDTTPPVVESGGGGGTSPSNDTYTNQSSTNFTVNASDSSGIQNVTLFILNESDDVINITTQEGYGALDIFFGFIYDLWYDGIYKWFFRVVDTVGNIVDSVINVVTYDATSPNVTIVSITNVSTTVFPVNVTMNYTINDTNINACYYRLDSGTNQSLNCSENLQNVSVNSEGYHNVTIYGIDLAGNSQVSQAKKFYVFYHTYNQSTPSPITTEGSIVTFDIEINETNYFPTVAYLIYNGIEYLADSYNIVGNKIELTKTLTIPDGTGNETGKTSNWNWKYAITGWEENYSTSSQSQIVYSVEIDDCSSYGEVILHFDLNDEETDTTIPYVIENISTIPSVEAEVQIVSLGNPDYYWQFNTTWTNETNGSICVPTGLLNYSDYRFDGVLSYVAGSYVEEFWYIDNGLLSYGEFALTNYTNRNITLRDLLLDDSTTFLFKYFDENYLIHEGAIVTALRKYIGEGVFKEVERCKLDDNGECHFHLVEEDVIYKFRITDEAELEYLSGEYNAKCLVTPCKITLNKLGEAGEWETEIDNLPTGTYQLISDKEDRTVTLAFNLDETGTMDLEVYDYDSDAEADVLIASDSATAKTGSVEVLVPLTYGNKTYYAVVRYNDEFVTSKWIDLSEDGFNYFGALGLFLGALLVLTLGLIAVSSGGWTVVFLIVGLLVATITKLVNMDFYLIMWVVSAGGLIIWKLSTRRSI